METRTAKGGRRIKAAALAIVVALTCAAGDMAGNRTYNAHKPVATSAQRSE